MTEVHANQFIGGSPELFSLPRLVGKPLTFLAIFLFGRRLPGLSSLPTSPP